MDLIGVGFGVIIFVLCNWLCYNEDGYMVNYLFIFWWGYEVEVNGELNFLCGYYFEIGSGFGELGVWVFGDFKGYGELLKDEVKVNYGVLVYFVL